MIAVPGYLHISHLNRKIDFDDSSANNNGGTASVIKGKLKNPSDIKKFNVIEVAVKFLNSSVDQTRFHYETAIMSSLPDSPYIAKLLGYCETPMAIIMPYYSLTMTSVFTESKLGKEELASKAALEIALGMELLHDKGIVHFDLKPGKLDTWHGIL